MNGDSASVKSVHSKGSSLGSGGEVTGIGRGSLRRRGTGASSVAGGGEDDRPHRVTDADWGIGDDARMGLE